MPRLSRPVGVDRALAFSFDFWWKKVLALARAFFVVFAGVFGGGVGESCFFWMVFCGEVVVSSGVLVVGFED
jgi:hypothetical protein